MGQRLKFVVNRLNQLLAVDGRSKQGFQHRQQGLCFFQSKASGRHGFILMQAAARRSARFSSRFDHWFKAFRPRAAA
jgi:hypothetical protein